MTMPRFFRRLPLIVLAVLLVSSVALNVVMFLKIRGMQNDPTLKTMRENATLIEQVGKLMVLPDETPTIATVTDPAKLKDQEFFAAAKVGDKVLIYTGIGKAILYDPTANKITNVAPVTVNAPAKSDTTSPPADIGGTQPKSPAK